MSALTTSEQIDTFRMLLIHRAIGFYLKTGMQVNRAYTPANLKRMVSSYTGVLYARSRKGLEMAYGDIGELLEQAKN